MVKGNDKGFFVGKSSDSPLVKVYFKRKNRLVSRANGV